MIADVTRGLSEWWAPVLAFVAGVVSFASPCVLPLVPGYLAFVSGSGGAQPQPGGGGVGSERRPAPEPDGVDGSSASDPIGSVGSSAGPVGAAGSSAGPVGAAPGRTSDSLGGAQGRTAEIPGGGGAVALHPSRPAASPSGEAVAEQVRRSGAGVSFLPMVLFVLGFAIVFTTLGVVVGQFPQSGLNRALHSSLLLRIAGAFVLLFGAAMILYAFRLGSPSLYAERRPLLSRVRPGPAGALPLGMAFALGWTPCIGPVLGVILAIAATQGGAFRGGGLLFLYSLGLGLPFLLIGFGLKRLMQALDVIKRNYHWFAGISGVIMVAIGVLLVSGLWESWITPWLNSLSRITPPL
jgi:cytochrome c-type biogenesis protein